MINKNKLTLFIVFMFCFLFAQSKVCAEGMNIDAQAGFGGKCKLGGINPVKVTVESSEDNVEGILKLKVGNKEYQHKLELTGGAKKEYYFSVPVLEESKELNLTIVNDGKIIDKKNVPMDILSKNSPIIGVISENPERYRYLKNIKLDFLKDREITVTDISDNADYSLENMKNFNVIVIDDFTTESLSKEKQQILNSWIADGGMLIVGSGKYGFKNISGILSEINNVTNVNGGVIIPVNFDIDNNSKIKELEDKIKENISYKALYSMVNGENIKEQALKAQELQSSAHNLLKPDHGLIYFLIASLILYLIVILVIVYTKKTKNYIWILSIAIFSILFYGISWFGGFGKVKLVSASARYYGEKINTYRLTNIYPSKDSIEIKFHKGSSILGLSEGQYTVDPIDSKVSYKPSTDKNYLFTINAEQNENEEIKLNMEEEKISGKLKNYLTEDLKNSIMVVGDTAIKIGDLDSMEEVELNYSLDHNLSNLSDYNYASAVEKLGNLNSYEKQLFNYYFYNIKDTENSSYIIGFTKENEKMNVNNKNNKIKEMCINVLPIKFNLNKGKIHLPEGYIKPVLDLKGKKIDGTVNEIEISSKESLDIYYSIPNNIELDEITINSKVDSGNATFQVFNRKEKVWKTVSNDLLKGNNVKNLVAKGPLSIRVTGEGRIIIPQISIKGTLKGEVK